MGNQYTSEPYRYLAVGPCCYGFGATPRKAQRVCGEWAIVVDRKPAGDDVAKIGTVCMIDGPDISGEVVGVHRTRGQKYKVGQLCGRAKS